METASTTIPTPKDALYANGTNGSHATPPSHAMTWEDYLAEGTVWGRYDIIEGVRYSMSGPIFKHQRVCGNIYNVLRAYEERDSTGIVQISPFDVLIRRTPKVQMRQPDAFFVTNDRLAHQPDYGETGYLTVTPNLIVEVLSDSDRKSIVAAKLADYFSIGVEEAWIIRPDDATVAVLTRGLTDYVEAALYSGNDTLVSQTLPGLTAPVADLLKP